MQLLVGKGLVDCCSKGGNRADSLELLPGEGKHPRLSGVNIFPGEHFSGEHFSDEHCIDCNLSFSGSSLLQEMIITCFVQGEGADYIVGVGKSVE